MQPKQKPTHTKRLLSWNLILQKRIQKDKPMQKTIFLARTSGDEKFDDIMDQLDDDTVNGIVLKISKEFDACNNSSINLSNQNIRGIAAEAVGDCLQTARCSGLNLSHNFLRDEDVTLLTKHLLDKKCSLHNLDLSNNRIGIPGAKTIGKVLGYNKSLKEINIDVNSISGSGIEDIAQALAKNQSVVFFSANWNPLGLFAEEFYFTLVRNTHLQVLQLGYCELKDRVAEALADGLVHNTSLQELYLMGNVITDKGGVALSVAIMQNHNLKYLNLKSNLLTDVTGNKFVDLVEDKMSRRLHFVVNLSDNKLSVELENELGFKRAKSNRKETVLFGDNSSVRSRGSNVNERAGSGYSFINNKFYQFKDPDEDEEDEEESESEHTRSSSESEA